MDSQGSGACERLPRLLTTAEAARLLRVSADLLRRDRRSGDPTIPAVRLGERSWRYPEDRLRVLVEGGVAGGVR